MVEWREKRLQGSGLWYVVVEFLRGAPNHTEGSRCFSRKMTATIGNLHSPALDQASCHYSFLRFDLRCLVAYWMLGYYCRVVRKRREEIVTLLIVSHFHKLFYHPAVPEKKEGSFFRPRLAQMVSRPIKNPLKDRHANTFDLHN